MFMWNKCIDALSYLQKIKWKMAEKIKTDHKMTRKAMCINFPKDLRLVPRFVWILPLKRHSWIETLFLNICNYEKFEKYIGFLLILQNCLQNTFTNCLKHLCFKIFWHKKQYFDFFVCIKSSVPCLGFVVDELIGG